MVQHRTPGVYTTSSSQVYSRPFQTQKAAASAYAGPAPSGVDLGHREGNEGRWHSPQHLSWPLESTAQECSDPHVIAVAVRPAPSERAGRKSPIWLSW